MTADYFDDDENVKMMRETARTIGLTRLLLRALNSHDGDETKRLLAEALRLLGISGEVRS